MDFSKRFPVRQIQHFNKPVDIQQTEPLAIADNLMISAPWPIHRVTYDTGANHVEINVTQAIPKMVTAIDHCGMESLSPEGAAAMFAEVVVISKLALQLLHELAEIARMLAHSGHMNVIAGDAEIQKRNAMFMNCVSKASAILDSIEPAFQQELSVVASVSQVINVAGDDVAVGSWQGAFSN